MSLPPGRGPLVFVSFAAADEEHARKLKEELSKRGARVWEPEHLNRVARVLNGVEEAIRRSDAFVVLLSEAGSESTWVQMEIGAALAVMGQSETSKVVPVVLGDAQLPAALRSYRSIFVRNNDWSAVADNLVEHRSEIAEADLWQEVRDLLKGLEVDAEAAPIIGGVRPDFVIRDGRRLLVLEVKPWSGPGIIDAIHALNQLSFQVDAVGAERGLLVVHEVRTAMPDPSIVGLAALPDAIRAWRDEVEVASSIRAGPPAPRQIFAAMPFAPEYSDTYWVAMREAAKAIDAGCVRVDEIDYVGDVVAKILELITKSDAVIADLSESAPNVLFELGFAFALGKTCILICSTPLSELPFDIRNQRTIAYAKGQTYQLKEDLIQTLRAVL
ncbi:MAG TPA: toll/interleukin-1 receptor domain-containing protein [Solirubrobacterales bacterium]|nr:toll/interleukin-1 receptor domain-containing protein [Solirubrobacterales bacterium]